MRTVGVLIAVLAVLGPVPAHANDAVAQGVPVMAAPPGSPASDAPTGLATLPDLRPVYRVATKDPVVFITIDDGVHKDAAARALVERKRIPVTSFLTAWTVKDRTRFFERSSAFGSIQNHSATHASFSLVATDLDHEICYTQRKLSREFDERPWMLRPPYGAAAESARVRAVARRCGIQQIVMWDTVIEDGRPQYRGSGLRPGSIILLHYGKDLAADLQVALRIAKKAGLRPADLATYLPRMS